MKTNPHQGSTLDSFLHEEGIHNQVTTAAVIEAFVEEARSEMERRHLSQSRVARLMGTSRIVLNRLFRPRPANVRVATLVRFAAALDKDLRIELVDRPKTKRPAPSMSSQLPPISPPPEKALINLDGLGQRWHCHPKTAWRRMLRLGVKPIKLSKRSILFRMADVLRIEALCQ